MILEAQSLEQGQNGGVSTYSHTAASSGMGENLFLASFSFW